MPEDDELLSPIPKINHWNINQYIEDYLTNNPALISGLFLVDGVWYG